ncbi:MAG TPA: response regulator [Thermoanaerobaculia bacterium]|jgi:CheY-like chemotaxis protein/anti-sigma regulatory factor (Ser/Thr protein kinase)|nr:response regulator [Thermoanaerobaculia bacterium]
MTADTTRVLIVDDNPHDRALLTEHLSREGYEIETAEDGVEAFHLLERDPWRYDVVLLDRNMPRLGGVELLQWLKANSELRSLPVILQTASDSRVDLLAAMKGGAFYYLTKPYDVEMMLTVVATAARDRASYRQLQSVSRRSEMATGLLRSATFRLRTIEEARDVGTLVAGFCPDPANTVIGLTELIVNAVEHGNLGITYAEKSELNGVNRWLDELERRAALPENLTKFVDVTYERDVDEIRITVRDQGPGFDWRPYLEPDLTRVFDTHGRGITIARRLSFDDLEYRGAGNEVVAKLGLV